MDRRMLRRMPFRLLLARNATECLHRMRRLEQAVILGFDAEALHAYRVALRRLRALLWSVRRDLPDGWYHRVRERTRALAAPTSPVRDLDVLIERAEQWNALDGELEPMLAMLYRRRQQAHERLEQWLCSRNYEALMTAVGADLSALTQMGGERLLRGRARKSAEAVYDRLQKRFRRGCRKLRADSADARFHRLRVLGKNVRYFGEAFAPVLGKAAARRSKRMKAVQDILGSINDCSVQLDLIEVIRGEAETAAMIDPKAWYRLGFISAGLAADIGAGRAKFLENQARLIRGL